MSRLTYPLGETGVGAVPLFEPALGYIAGLDALVVKMTNGDSGHPETIFWSKHMTTTNPYANHPTGDIEGSWVTCWYMAGNPSQGDLPTSGAPVKVCTSSTSGALPFTPAGGNRDKFIVQSFMTTPGRTSYNGAIRGYDRLLHGYVDSQVTTAQTIGGAITRNVGGAGNFNFIEHVGDLGGTIRSCTISYTNQDGTAGRSCIVRIAGNAPQIYRAPNLWRIGSLQAGDTGVRSIQSATMDAVTATAGYTVVGIGTPLFLASEDAKAAQAVSTSIANGAGGMIGKVNPDACIALARMGSATTCVAFGGISMVEA